MKKILIFLAILMMAVTSAFADVTISLSKSTFYVGEEITATITGIPDGCEWEYDVDCDCKYEVSNKTEKSFTLVINQGGVYSLQVTGNYMIDPESDQEFFDCSALILVQNPIVSIAVTGTPEVFHVGDTFNHNGMTVTATYYNGETKDVTDEAEFDAPNMTRAGYEKVLVWMYGEQGGQAAEYWITIINTPVNLDETATTEPSFTGTSYDVTVNRTLKANQWNSLCLPFSMTADEIKSSFGDGVQVMKMDKIDNNVVNFAETETIDAGDMCIVKPAAAVSPFTVKGKTLSTPEGKTFGDWTVYSPMYQTEISPEEGKTTYVLSNNKFYTLDNTQTVKGFRWYIQSTTPNARALTLSLDGEETGINGRK